MIVNILQPFFKTFISNEKKLIKIQVKNINKKRKIKRIQEVHEFS